MQVRVVGGVKSCSESRYKIRMRRKNKIKLMKGLLALL